MSELRFIFSSFDNLTSRQLEAVFNLRQRVFIIEQQCLYEDIDGFDNDAEHLLAYEKDTLAGYLRILKPGIKFKNAASIGRIVVDYPFRGTHVGKELITKGIKITKEKYPGIILKIEAQAALTIYYQQFNFQPIGETYLVDGISHLMMILKH